MPRVGSGDGFDIALWEQGDNPGAGSQDFTVFTDTGLNGNWKRLWRAIKSLVNPDGTVQDDKIDGRNLKNTSADGATIEMTAASGVKQYRIKDDGVTTPKILDGSVTLPKLAPDSVDATKLKDDTSIDANRAVTTDHIRDGAITLAKHAAASVDASKITHDNVRTKALLALDYNGTSGRVAGTALTTTVGIAMPRAGCITGFSICMADGTVRTNTAAYDSGSATKHFAAGNKISIGDISGLIGAYIIPNTPPSGFAISVSDSGIASGSVILIEVEYD